MVGRWDGTPSYLEPQADGTQLQRAGWGQNLFRHINMGYRGVPAIADVDGDGDFDLVVASRRGSSPTWSARQKAHCPGASTREGISS